MNETNGKDERRHHPRLLCADLVEVEFRDQTSRRRLLTANLEDISLSGACLQTEKPLPMNAPVRIRYGKGDLPGRVRYCVYREIGYFLGVEFDPGVRWNQRAFRPQHLIDPRRLVSRTLLRMDQARRPA